MGSVHGRAKRGAVGCGIGSTATCELSSDELGQRLLTRFVIARFL